MQKFVIMGPPGCGKGTQAKKLCKRFDLTHLSVGDMFRWNIQSHTKLAAKVKRIIDSGQLVGDDIVDEVIRRRLDEHDWNFGFVLDGFPRNLSQANFLLESYNVDNVVVLETPDDVVMERVLARRVCGECGVDFNLIYHRPADPNVCDVCGGKLLARTDDTEVALRKRLADYHSQTEAAVKTFDQKGLTIHIDGTKPIEAVFTEVCGELKLAVG